MCTGCDSKWAVLEQARLDVTVFEQAFCIEMVARRRRQEAAALMQKAYSTAVRRTSNHHQQVHGGDPNLRCRSVRSRSGHRVGTARRCPSSGEHQTVPRDQSARAVDANFCTFWGASANIART